MGEDGRNGSRPSIHPVGDEDFGVEDHNMDAKAAAAVAARVARRQDLADNDIDGLEAAVERIEDGETEWQMAVDRKVDRVEERQKHQKQALQKLHDEIGIVREDVRFIRRLLVIEKVVRPTLFNLALIVAGMGIGFIIFSFVRG